MNVDRSSQDEPGGGKKKARASRDGNDGRAATVTDKATGGVTPLEGPRYIVVEGPIGVGKTSLARRLAMTFESELILEEAEQNPFLERFYRNPGHAALPAQLYFLLQRARQIERLNQTDMFTPVRVADFMLEKDRLFAELTLDRNELGLYEQVAATLAMTAPVPDLVIYLQAPAPVLMRRITSRGIGYEQQIDVSYLERLGEAYARFFHEFDAAPLLIVNAASIDPIHRESDYQELLATIQKVRHGRHFFNPAIGSFA